MQAIAAAFYQEISNYKAEADGTALQNEVAVSRRSA
jgi:hypothetical protein